MRVRVLESLVVVVALFDAYHIFGDVADGHFISHGLLFELWGGDECHLFSFYSKESVGDFRVLRCMVHSVSSYSHVYHDLKCTGSTFSSEPKMAAFILVTTT